MPLHGSATVYPDGSFRYTPDAGFVGTDTFGYVAVDQDEHYSPTTTVSIAVRAANHVPIALGQTVATMEDQSATMTLLASDQDADALSFTVSNPAHGTLTGVAPNLTYTPVHDFAGVDSFEFTVSDGALTSQPATVSVSIDPVNDPPTLSLSAPPTATEGAPIAMSISVIDPDGPALDVGWTLAASTGAGAVPCVLDGSGTARTMRCTDNARVLVRGTVSDGIISVATTATVDVANAAPVVSMTSPSTGTTVAVGTSIAVAASIVDSGSSDTHSCELRDSRLTSVVAGIVSAGVCRVSIAPTATGSHILTVTVNDDDGGSGSATVTVTVTGPSPPLG